jgi:multiphosphoryl transfer protein
MAVEYRFKFPLPNGLHARPASHIEALTSRFRSAITLIPQRTLYRANTRSVLSMVSADIKFNDECLVLVEGEDEKIALEAVRRFLEDELPKCDEALPEVAVQVEAKAFPRSLKAAGLTDYLRGKAVCGGIGSGKALIVGALQMPVGFEHDKAKDPAYESDRATGAIAAVAAEIDQKISSASRAKEIEVLKAHASIIRDVGLSELISKLIFNEHRTAAQAIAGACESFSDTLRKSQNSYLRERVLDIEDICLQLLHRVLNRPISEVGAGDGTEAHTSSSGKSKQGQSLSEACICIADHLTPGQFLALDHKWIRGLVLGDGGTTSHTVILARSMNIPTLVGVPDALSIRQDQELLLDGNLGLLVTKIPPAVQRYYAMERDRLNQRRLQLESFKDVEGMTADQHPIEVAANIASAEEAAIAFDAGAQGIGLFRTEMLFMDRADAPSEEEQTAIYSAALVAGKGRPVIIRLLDIGGDKPAEFLKFPVEANPFLGYRGARLYEEFSTLIKTQLRAILRASVGNANAKILVPMVCCLEEVHSIKRMLGEAAQELAELGISLNPLPPLGVMVEIPSLAFVMPELCKELDFFSIGSNDLTQYFLAADRSNEKVSQLYKWSHPAFLRLLRTVVDQAHLHGKWIGLCGEMGDDPSALPILVGLGLDEISVSPPRVGAVKAAISKLNYADCQLRLAEASNASTRAGVESMAQAALAHAADAPLLSQQLIFQPDGRTKQEVIKLLSDQLYLAGRVDEPQLLEEAIWNREDTYSTGFGHGFALPHCKSKHLASNSIVVARLAKPVEWGSLDEKPVDVVLLLAIREKEDARAHMKIFAKLSRLVMRDEFRDQIRNQTDSSQLTEFLKQNLQIDPVLPA